MLSLFPFVAVFFWFLRAQALLSNITIDDTTGDSVTGALVAYAPADAWTNGQSVACAQGSHCPPGTPNLDNLGGRSFHNSTFSVDSGRHPNVPLTATVQFNGSAVYVYCALSRAPNDNADMIFYLDGVVVGRFSQTPVGTAGYDYTVLVYTNPSIPQGQHTLTIQNGQQNGVRAVMVLDSIVYTTDDDASPTGTQQAYSPSAPSTPSSSRRGPSGATLAVVGVLVFAVVVILAVLGVCLYRRRRRRRTVYAKYMPQGAVRAFPPDMAPSHPPTPSLAALPPVYAGGGGSPISGNWWVGRDQKSRDGPRTIHRPFEDLDPSQAGLQRPPGWERKSSYQFDQ